MGRHTISIEQVEIRRGDGPGDPEASKAINRLFSKWLVRAYIRRYNDDMEDDAVEQAKLVEVLR